MKNFFMISNRIVWSTLGILLLLGLTSLLIATRFTFTLEAFHNALSLYPKLLINSYVIGFIIFWVLGAFSLAGVSATTEVPKIRKKTKDVD